MVTGDDVREVGVGIITGDEFVDELALVTGGSIGCAAETRAGGEGGGVVASWDPAFVFFFGTIIIVISAGMADLLADTRRLVSSSF